MTEDRVVKVERADAGKAFSAGGDLRMMRAGDMSPAELHEFVRVEFGGVSRATSSSPPSGAQLGTAYIHLGLSPLGVSYLLAKSIGYARAYELCALGEVLDARRAESLGLVDRVVPHDKLMEEARARARRLADGPPRALGFTKRLLRQAVQGDLEQHPIAGEAIQPLLLWTEDHREAVRAFGEKRPPRFTGR